MISCFDAVEYLVALRKEELVVGTMTPNRYWSDLSDKPDHDLPIYGGMGKASSVALGLAMSQTTRRVWCVDGDGSLLMNLGALVTISGQAPVNFVHFVFDDEAYQTTGSQPVPGAGRYNLKLMAESAGYPEAYLFDDLEDFKTELPDIIKKEGPVMVVLKIHYPNGGPPYSMGSTKDAVDEMRNALGTR